MNKVLLLVFYIGLNLSSMAQEDSRIRIPKAIVTWRHTVQPQDYLMGIDFGLTNRSQNLIGQFVIDFRPHSRKVQEYIGNNTFYQYSEKRFIVGAGIEHLMELKESNKGVFIGLNGVYNFGEYRGVSYKPEQGWGILPRVGMFWNIFHETSYLKLGYQYLDSRSDTVTKHWVFLSISIVLDPL